MAQNAELKWVLGFENTQYYAFMTPSMTDFQLDNEGNVYVVGHFDSGNTWLDGTDVDPVHFPCIMSSIYHGLYVAKIDSNGNRIWIKSLRTSLKSDMNNGAYLTISNLILKGTHTTVLSQSFFVTSSSVLPSFFLRSSFFDEELRKN